MRIDPVETARLSKARWAKQASRRAVTLTKAAARHVQRYLAKRGKGVGVRLGVKTTGCSGLAYKLEYVDDALPPRTWCSRTTA